MDSMEALEASINKADAVLSEGHAALVAQGNAALIGHAALPRKLAAIYAEEASKPSKIKQNIVHTSELVGKLVERDNLSCLIVNLYHENEGYNIALKLPGGLETETIRLSYEDDEFLNYINQERLPPMLLDLLDDAGVSDMFQCGCLVAELRDYRRCGSEPPSLASALNSSAASPLCDKRHVLLRPSMQSIAADITYLTREKDWSSSERSKLEAEIVRATAPPLCLSPDLSASLITRRLHTRNTMLCSPQMRRAAKRFSQPSLNRQKKFEEGPAPKCLRLMNFLNDRKEKRPIAKAIPKPLVPLISEQTLGPNPSELFGGSIPNMKEFMDHVIEEVQKYAKPMEKPPEGGDYSLQFIEEYTLETEKSQGRIYHTKLTIYQRRIDEVFCGELYVDRDYQEGKLNGSTCTFKHHSLQSVHRYIAQFREIFSEEGRKSVKIKHVVAGQAPRVYSTTGSRDRAGVTEQLRHAAAAAASQHKQQPQQLQLVSGTSATAGPFNQQQNLLIVTNGDRNLSGALQQQQQTQQQKVPAGAVVISKSQSLPVVAAAVQQQQQQRLHHAATAQLTGLSVSQQNPQQQQPVLLSRNLHLSSLLSGRTVVSSAQQAVVTGRTALHTTGNIGMGATVSVKGGELKTEPVLASAGPGAVPALQALLAGTPSAENPAPNSRNSELIKRLSLQSSQPNKGDHKASVKVDITASALPTITTINCTPTTGSLVCSNNSGNSTLSSLLSSSSNNSSSQQQSSIQAAVLRSDSANGPPPNINIANIANLPGLNVGLQNLTSGVQNVQVSIPGLPVPISLSLSAGPPPSSTSLPPQGSAGGGNQSSSSGTSSTSTAGAPTVVLASAASLPQGHLLQLPIVQGSQLAAQLTKPQPGQHLQQQTTVSVLQSSSSSGGVSVGGHTYTSSGGGGHTEVLVSSAGLLPRPPQPVLPRTSKQQLQLALQKPSQGQINQHLQQKLVQLAAIKSQQQQQQQIHVQQQQLQQQQQLEQKDQQLHLVQPPQPSL